MVRKQPKNITGLFGLIAYPLYYNFYSRKQPENITGTRTVWADCKLPVSYHLVTVCLQKLWFFLGLFCDNSGQKCWVLTILNWFCNQMIHWYQDVTFTIINLPPWPPTPPLPLSPSSPPPLVTNVERPNKLDSSLLVGGTIISPRCQQKVKSTGNLSLDPKRRFLCVLEMQQT